MPSRFTDAHLNVFRSPDSLRCMSTRVRRRWRNRRSHQLSPDPRPMSAMVNNSANQAIIRRVRSLLGL